MLRHRRDGRNRKAHGASGYTKTCPRRRWVAERTSWSLCPRRMRDPGRSRPVPAAPLRRVLRVQRDRPGRARAAAAAGMGQMVAGLARPPRHAGDPGRGGHGRRRQPFPGPLPGHPGRRLHCRQGPLHGDASPAAIVPATARSPAARELPAQRITQLQSIAPRYRELRKGPEAAVSGERPGRRDRQARGHHAWAEARSAGSKPAAELRPEARFPRGSSWR